MTLPARFSFSEKITKEGIRRMLSIAHRYNRLRQGRWDLSPSKYEGDGAENGVRREEFPLLEKREPKYFLYLK
ncbi:hypothetical protein AKJ57_02070 [candidate division MSBL1 archaeon SCGC-AAA259A05]|uniref:Uncharacterized protein n=1 Tax=candidate division MSBL1 archaeon SCGC-AAA259A05 TaxID=1698259 RepID=A0A133UAH6_9EURY|nr:hypothetical protein AKJ57_02070 [candidate division MSBL1 archaeon SCGC-AAA259A05]